MQLAFSFPPTIELAEFGATIERAEHWGFDMAYTPDQGYLRDPFIALTHAATRTKQIALGLAVTTPYTRHPIYIARAAGTLADLRSGNFILGLGAGERGNLRDRLAAPQTPFLPLLRETIRVLRELFAGRKVSSETPAFTLNDVGLEFTPRHPIPIYVATTDPAGMRLVGEIADGLILGDVADPNVLTWAIELVREGARAAGRDPAGVTIVSWVTTIVHADSGDIKNRLQRVMAGAVLGMHKTLRAQLGFDEAAVARFRTALADNALNATLLDDCTLDRLMITGEAESCLARMRALEKAGAGQLAARMPAAVADTVDFQGNLQKLATQILPQLRVSPT